MARFKNVYYRREKKKPWRGVIRGPVQQEKCFLTKREAMSFVVRSRGGRPLEVSTTPETKCRVARHRYITKDKASGWRVFAGQKRHYARTYRDAIQLACKLHKCSPKDLKKKLSLQGLRKRMPAWMRLYHKRYPGDIEHIMRTARVHAGLFRRYPCLMYFLILLKYGYPRDLWISECRKHGLSQTGRTVSPEQMASKLSAILRKVTLKLDGWWKSDDAKVWVKNCGKDVSHVLGPVPLLRALGVIVKAKHKTSNNSTGILRFGLGGQKFRLATSATQTKKCKRNWNL